MKQANQIIQAPLDECEYLVTFLVHTCIINKLLK